MTEQQLRDKVIKIAYSFFGYNEADGSHKDILAIYNNHEPLARRYKVKSTDAWCATFVSAVFIKAGLTGIAPTECSCPKMIELYKKLGRWIEADNYVPKPGDVIMYDWQDSGSGDNTGNPDHVGIVYSISGSTMKIIEGNMSNRVDFRKMQVNGKNIRGYCVPNYANTAESVPESAAKPTVKEPVKEPAKEKKPDAARSYDRKYAKPYTVTASGLNLRMGAGTTKDVIKVLKKGEKVTCYGYFTTNGSTIWLYVKDKTGQTGFCSKKYLK